jgi:hypothetical protein
MEPNPLDLKTVIFALAALAAGGALGYQVFKPSGNLSVKLDAAEIDKTMLTVAQLAPNAMTARHCEKQRGNKGGPDIIEGWVCCAGEICSWMPDRDQEELTKATSPRATAVDLEPSQVGEELHYHGKFVEGTPVDLSPIPFEPPIEKPPEDLPAEKEIP